MNDLKIHIKPSERVNAYFDTKWLSLKWIDTVIKYPITKETFDRDRYHLSQIFTELYFRTKIELAPYYKNINKTDSNVLGTGFTPDVISEFGLETNDNKIWEVKTYIGYQKSKFNKEELLAQLKYPEKTILLPIYINRETVFRITDQPLIRKMLLILISEFDRFIHSDPELQVKYFNSTYRKRSATERIKDRKVFEKLSLKYMNITDKDKIGQPFKTKDIIRGTLDKFF